MMVRLASIIRLGAMLCSLAVALLICTCPGADAGEAPKRVLIINSNNSVHKYRLSQSAFNPKGMVEQSTIDLSSPWADEGKIRDRIRSEHPDVIYCIGTKAYLLAHKVAGKTPVIFSTILKWQRLPVGQHTFGVAMELPTSMQVTTYRYFFPDIKRIGILYSKAYSADWLKEASDTAAQAGVEIVATQVDRPSDLSHALKEMLSKVDAVWLTPDPEVLASRKAVQEIFRQAGAMRKPVFAYSDVFAPFGATLMVSADIATMARQASALTDAVIAGEPIEQKVEYPAGSHIALNIDKVEQYGLHLRAGTLQSVNRIIR